MPVNYPLLLPHAWRATARIASALVAFALMTACAADKPGPTGLSARESAATSNGVPFSVGLASPAWQATARDFASHANFSPLAAARAYPLLGVAQYWAVQSPVRRQSC